MGGKIVSMIIFWVVFWFFLIECFWIVVKKLIWKKDYVFIYGGDYVGEGGDIVIMKWV